MRFISMLALCLFTSGIVLADKPLVSECTSDSMREITIGALRSYANEILHFKEIEYQSVDVAGIGKQEFAESWSTSTNKPNLVIEDAYRLEVLTKKGSRLQFYSTYFGYIGDDGYGDLAPLNYVISLPDPSVVDNYDDEGNIVSQTCQVGFVNQTGRLLKLRNLDSNKVLYRHEYEKYWPHILVEVKLVK